jgi:hypothetical protein
MAMRQTYTSPSMAVARGRRVDECGVVDDGGAGLLRCWGGFPDVWYSFYQRPPETVNY